MEQLIDFKDAQIEALQNKLTEVNKQIEVVNLRLEVVKMQLNKFKQLINQADDAFDNMIEDYEK